MTRQKVGEVAGMAIYADPSVPPDMVYMQQDGVVVAAMDAAQRIISDPQQLARLTDEWRFNGGNKA